VGGKSVPDDRYIERIPTKVDQENGMKLKGVRVLLALIAALSPGCAALAPLQERRQLRPRLLPQDVI